MDEVNLVFTAVDKHGRFIKDLPKDAFELLDNSAAPQSIGYFQQQSNLPLRVALLIDLSDSVRSRFKFEQEAASLFLKKILRPGKDEAFIVGFDSRPHLEQEMTGDVQKLSKAIRRLMPGGDTALYDAVMFASNKLEKQSTRGVVIRRAIMCSATEWIRQASPSWKMQPSPKPALKPFFTRCAPTTQSRIRCPKGSKLWLP